MLGCLFVCLLVFPAWHGVWMISTLTFQNCVDSSNAAASQVFKYLVYHICIHKVFYRPWDSTFWSVLLRTMSSQLIVSYHRKHIEKTKVSFIFFHWWKQSFQAQDETGHWSISQSSWMWRAERKCRSCFVLVVLDHMWAGFELGAFLPGTGTGTNPD